MCYISKSRWVMAYKHLQLTMKRIIFLMFVLLSTSVSLEAKKVKPVQKSSWEQTSSHSEKGKLISFDCILSSTAPGFLSSFVCNNGTDERIFIEWENSRLNGGKVIFGDDTRLSMRNPKADEAVSPHGCSIIRKIASMNQIHPEITYALFPASVDKVLRKELGKKGTVEVKIPVRFADNHIEEYILIYSIWYEMPQTE